MAKCVYQFKISLKEIEPTIWRRILVPEAYSFWDLHVAIQDSMGWLDSHLHAFRFGRQRSRFVTEIGIPMDDDFGAAVLPGWEVSTAEFFDEVGEHGVYEYDFGDGWEHDVLLEGILLREKGRRYPCCVGGARACPPEDCGGVPGYYHLLEVIRDPSDEEYEDLRAWLGGNYDPGEFAMEKVKFHNPKIRWKQAFSD